FRMEAQLGLLKQFIQCVSARPEMLHQKDLAFFKEFIESFGGKIPNAPAPKAEEPKKEEEKKADEPMEEEEPAIERPHLDESGVIEAETDEPLPMGDEGKEPSDSDMETASAERETAQSALSDGDTNKAIEHFTNAIQANPHSAALFAKRAQCLIKQNKPVGAIRDCDRAIALNADSAIAYKFRGKAHRLLGHWVEAHTDLAMACKLDYDEAANEWLKEVEPNAKKMKEYLRAVERQTEEKELKERRERVRKAQEERQKAYDMQQEEEESMGGGGGGMGGLGEIFGQMMKDPEMKEAMQDPEVAGAVFEIMQNPSALMKHMGNPKVMAAFSKLKGMFGGMSDEGEHAHEHGEGGCCGGHDDASTGGEETTKASTSHSHSAPMPDLD
ncbi:hypothetical protein PFISCL1PPCAC_10639, partial [Pristionchus fissidentatus]